MPDKGNETVKVVVRCRPLFGKEIVEKRKEIVEVDTVRGIIVLNHPESKSASGQANHTEPKRFTFDGTYDKNTVQKDFYDDVGYPLVESVMEGFNGTIFAYGQTGCGKTFTMQGASDPPTLRGVIPNSFDHLFANVDAAPEGVQFLIRCQYLEIYNEEVRDLLGKDPTAKLALKESKDKGVYVQGITEAVCEDIESINETMERGFDNRTVGATLMNAGSSRSHSIFTIVMEVAEKDEEGNDKLRAGKLNLVDLAGSERQNKTGASGDRLKEGCKINLSLSALGNVISALVDGKSKHIPYRDSKLTRLLQDSLGGNTKTVMVAAISPADYNYDETLSTLRYANRAKNIKNKPVINEDPKDAMLRQYKEEIDRLMDLLKTQQMLGPDGAAGAGMHAVGGPVHSPQQPRADGGDAAPAAAAAAAAGGSADKHKMKEMERQMAAMKQQMLMQQQQLVGMQDGDGENFDGKIANPLTDLVDTDLVLAQLSGSGSDFSAMPVGAQVTQLVPGPVQIKTVTKDRVVEKVVEKEVLVEVESEKSKAQRKALETYNQSVVEQRNKMGEEMEQKEKMVEAERQARNMLQAKLNALQSKVMGLGGRRGKGGKKGKDGGAGEQGGDGDGDEEDIDPVKLIARQQADFRRAQLKLRAEKKRKERLAAEKAEAQAKSRRMAEQLAAAKADHEKVGAELQIEKERLKEELSSAQCEIRDLAEEFEREREQLLESVRLEGRQNQLLTQVCELLFTTTEMARLYEKAQWDQDTETWLLPNIRPRKGYTKVNLPSLGGGGGGPAPGEGGPQEVTGGVMISDDDDDDAINMEMMMAGGGGGGRGSRDARMQRPESVLGEAVMGEEDSSGNSRKARGGGIMTSAVEEEEDDDDERARLMRGNGGRRAGSRGGASSRGSSHGEEHDPLAHEGASKSSRSKDGVRRRRRRKKEDGSSGRRRHRGSDRSAERDGVNGGEGVDSPVDDGEGGAADGGWGAQNNGGQDRDRREGRRRRERRGERGGEREGEEGGAGRESKRRERRERGEKGERDRRHRIRRSKGEKEGRRRRRRDQEQGREREQEREQGEHEDEEVGMDMDIDMDMDMDVDMDPRQQHMQEQEARALALEANGQMAAAADIRDTLGKGTPGRFHLGETLGSDREANEDDDDDVDDFAEMRRRFEQELEMELDVGTPPKQEQMHEAPAHANAEMDRAQLAQQAQQQAALESDSEESDSEDELGHNNHRNNNGQFSLRDNRNSSSNCNGGPPIQSGAGWGGGGFFSGPPSGAMHGQGQGHGRQGNNQLDAASSIMADAAGGAFDEGDFFIAGADEEQQQQQQQQQGGGHGGWQSNAPQHRQHQALRHRPPSHPSPSHTRGGPRPNARVVSSPSPTPGSSAAQVGTVTVVSSPQPKTNTVTVIGSDPVAAKRASFQMQQQQQRAPPRGNGFYATRPT